MLCELEHFGRPVIQRETHAIPVKMIQIMDEVHGVHFQPYWAAIRERFATVTQLEYLMEDEFETSCAYDLIDKEELDTLLAGPDGSRRFLLEFPGSRVIKLSRVVFAEDGEVAIVYSDEGSGWLGGEGYLWLLYRTPDRWLVGKRFNVWIS